MGGRFQLEDNAAGTIRTCDRPQGFSVTWEFGGDISYVGVVLAAEGADRSRVTVTHAADVPRDRRSQYGPGDTGGGWDLWFVALANHLRSGGPVDLNGWLESGAANDFAAEAKGASEAEAQAAEDRVTAFCLSAE